MSSELNGNMNDYITKTYFTDQLNNIMRIFGGQINTLKGENKKMKKKITELEGQNTEKYISQSNRSIECISKLIKNHKDQYVKTSVFHNKVKETCNISPQQIKIIVDSMGYVTIQRKGLRTYCF
jgi:CRISPR/Cas system-associated protein Cas10 (large subunit of type III CRISPR-Cas system)